MEEDSEKHLSDYTYEEYRELTVEEQDHLGYDATEEEADRWHDKYEKELLDDYPAFCRVLAKFRLCSRTNKSQEIRIGGKQEIITRNALALFCIALFIWCIPDLIVFLSKE
jgi:hypothetical protein